MPATYEPIASQTLGSAAASVTFSSIPGTYTDLIWIGQTRMTVSGSTYQVVTINGETGGVYSHTSLRGNGSSALSSRSTTNGVTPFHFFWESSTEWLAYRLHFQSYSNTNVFKTTLIESAEAGQGVLRGVCLRQSTSAITTLSSVVVGGGNFAAGSTFSLYGIKAA